MAMDEERQVNQTEQGEQRTEEPAAGERPSRRPTLRSLSRLLLLLAVVLVIVVLTTMEDGNHFASLRRWLMYGDSGTGQNYYTYAADSGNRFALLGEDLLVVNQNAIQLLEDDGSIRYNLPVSVVEPMVSVGGGTAAVCDVGGSSLYLLDETGVRRELTLSGGLRYYSARLNSAGWLAVTEEKNGYKASISVYNSSGELVLSFDSYDSYITDALVTEDCRYVAAVSLDPQESVFSSTLRIYDLSEALLAASCPIRDGLPMDITCTGDTLLALCDTRLALADLEGNLKLDYAYGSLYLHDYALGGGDFCALLLGRYQAGNICTLTTFDLAGQEIASLELSEEVLDLSAAGDYLAVLYSDSMVLYTRDLQEHARLEGTDYAGRVIMEEDGTALVLTGTAAWRFLP